MHDRSPVFGMVEHVFRSSPFVQHLGITFIGCGHGWCEAEVMLAPHHMQHMGQGHAGLTATMADNCAGAAAATMLEEFLGVVTLEFKLNLLRPAVGEKLVCRADVLKPGRSFTVVESAVHAIANQERKLVAKMMATIAFVPLQPKAALLKDN